MPKNTRRRILVTGDSGTDVFTRCMPGCLTGDRDIVAEDNFYPQIAYDVNVPSGGELIAQAIESLLGDCVLVDRRFPNANSLPEYLRYLHASKWRASNNRVLRIKDSAPLKRIRTKTGAPVATSTNHKPHFVIVHDATQSWRHSEQAGATVRDAISQASSRRPVRPHRVLVNIGWRVPNLACDHGIVTIDGQGSPVWQELYNHREKVTIVLSATDLRHAGAAISRRLSWEQTIGDAIADMQLFERFRFLTKFGHVIIRFGFVGALYLRHEGNERFGKFIFSPIATGGVFREEASDGKILGRAGILSACLIMKMIQSKGSESTTADTMDGITTSLLTSMRLFDSGFPCPSEFISNVDANSDAEMVADGIEFLRAYFEGNVSESPLRESPAAIIAKGYEKLLANEGKSIPRDRLFGHVTVPSRILRAKPAVGSTYDWQILRSQIKQNRMSRINIGIAICRFGHQHVLNRPLNFQIPEERMCGIQVADIAKILTVPECRLSANETDDEKPLQSGSRPAVPFPTTYKSSDNPQAKDLYIPMLQFGKLLAIERDEIESFRSIQNLMRHYVETQQSTGSHGKPISIAVFGAPGTGKSFAVTQIAKDINRSTDEGVEIEIIECNVAQFRSVKDLEHAITRIASANNKSRIPLVFFDEFDCEFEHKPLGWLKYFLGPMQDGTFYGTETITFGRAIFVFAGGIYHTIDEFDPISANLASLQSDSQSVEEQVRRQQEFKQQKGPDFVSRLRGHINIRSINPDKAAPLDNHGKPVKPIIRRALILREQIVQSNLAIDRDDCLVANIDSDVLYALLTVDRYRHGARSMAAILQMCNPANGQIEKASLPSRAQLNMHVDAEEFLIRVQRGRYRSALAAMPHTVICGEISSGSEPQNEESSDDFKSVAEEKSSPRKKKNASSRQPT